jgi:hypothetical protein
MFFRHAPCEVVTGASRKFIGPADFKIEADYRMKRQQAHSADISALATQNPQSAALMGNTLSVQRFETSAKLIDGA